MLYHDDELFIFGDKEFFYTLEKTNVILGDGTYKSVPSPPFLQLYDIHVLYESEVFPIFYCLMVNKSNRLYKKMFDLLCNISGFNFLERDIIFLGDFEVCHFSFMSQNIQRKACYFHYTQNIWRKCQNISQKEYNEHGNFYKLAKTLMVLPYIKVERIKNNRINI